MTTAAWGSDRSVYFTSVKLQSPIPNAGTMPNRSPTEIPMITSTGSDAIFLPKYTTLN